MIHYLTNHARRPIFISKLGRGWFLVIAVMADTEFFANAIVDFISIGIRNAENKEKIGYNPLFKISINN